jgi:hypothetical protein
MTRTAMERLNGIIHLIKDQKHESQLEVGAINKVDVLKIYERPFSHIAHCRLKGEEGEKKVYVKMYKDHRLGKKKDYTQRVLREFDVTSYWYEEFKKQERMGTTRPLLVFPDTGTIITEESPGKSLINVLSHARYFPAPGRVKKLKFVMKRTGEWLRQFQSIAGILQTNYKVDDLIADIDLRLRRLVDYKGLRFDNHKRHEILGYLHKYSRHLTEEERAMTYLHQDFTLSNILVNDRDIVVLDFSKINVGSVYYDASRMFHQLELLRFQPGYPKPMIRELQISFLEGYGKPQAIDPDSKLFRMFLVRHSITQIIKLGRFQQVGSVKRWGNRRLVFLHFRLINSILNCGYWKG